MKELRQLLAEATLFKNKRSMLAKELRNVDEKSRSELEKLESVHLAKVKNYEAERQTAFSAIELRAKKEISEYVRIIGNLQQYIDPVRQWCPNSAMNDYEPNQSRINESEVRRLVRMLQEEGIIAWIKRTFKLGGYSSRAEMAFELYCKIEDACAYCNARIIAIEERAELEKNKQITDTRRKISAEKTNYQNQRHELELRIQHEKEQALIAISKFDNSEELKDLYKKIEKMRLMAENSCGAWGTYSIPSSMPEQVLLCEANVSLPNANGLEEKKLLPVWINLYECNIIVVTSLSGATASPESEEKQFVRKLLARMLKTIPPENCSYSIFDSLHKGASLERLIDATNVGTTDLNFDLFTSNESDNKVVSCSERRKYLRNRPAEIIKFTAGRNKSLFDYSKVSGKFEFPFTWYIDFNFPESPDTRLLEDIKELFVNASAAGYSFIFVTTPKGFDIINSIARQYNTAKVFHIDADRTVCEKDGLELEYADSISPSCDQIYNFMTALKRFYDEGDLIDNHIDHVFLSNAIAMHEASRKLVVPMALDSRGRLVNLELGGEGSVHGFISGGTNSGKSTLLHTIILSACLHYHPQDLEIWLVDYKQTEFHLYKKNTPPHIKLIGVSKTADFTFSLLDRIESEANRRTELMNRFDARDLQEYRKHEGESGYEDITRLFIVIDEFHEMSQFVAADNEYKDKLENILREYRAQGITCLLADQTFSTGLSGLTPAAKNQIGLRIAMRNEASPQEIKDTLEVDRAMYSDSLQHTISIMSQGEFIMKVYVRNSHGELTDIKLEKFKGLLTKGDDIVPISKALRIIYNGRYKNNLLYVNTKEQTYWDDSDPAALDMSEPLRYPNIRFYLGRSATLRPCFGLDVGRQPNENVSIVGGNAHQRWELLASIMQSCRYNNYKLLVFMAEYSDLMCDFGDDIRKLCLSIPNAELMESYESWCSKLNSLYSLVEERQNRNDIVCLFIGLEIAKMEFSHFPERKSTDNAQSSFDDRLNARLAELGMASDILNVSQVETNSLFNALPIIDQLFSNGSRNGIRCITEISVYRQLETTLHLTEMCRHKIAFSMSADDCLRYLGSSSYQKCIGNDAVYCNGAKEVKKLLPYRLAT